MTAFGSLVVLAVALALGVMAAVLIRENKKLLSAGAEHQRLAVIASAVANLRKEHVALTELVESYMARQAVRSRRAKKKGEEEPEEDQPVSGEPLWFPSQMEQ